MAKQNDLYYNAAYIAFLGGILSGRTLASKTATDYLTTTQAAEAFANELDGKIANSNLVSGGGGLELAPTTATIQANEQHRVSLLQEIIRAACTDRYMSSVTASDYSDLCDRIVACWTEALLLLVTP